MECGDDRGLGVGSEGRRRGRSPWEGRLPWQGLDDISIPVLRYNGHDGPYFAYRLFTHDTTVY